MLWLGDGNACLPQMSWTRSLSHWRPQKSCRCGGVDCGSGAVQPATGWCQSGQTNPPKSQPTGQGRRPALRKGAQQKSATTTHSLQSVQEVTHNIDNTLSPNQFVAVVLVRTCHVTFSKRQNKGRKMKHWTRKENIPQGTRRQSPIPTKTTGRRSGGTRTLMWYSLSMSSGILRPNMSTRRLMAAVCTAGPQEG